MFGTSGIRGIYGKEITEDLASKVGNIFAKEGEKFVIGRDIRNSGRWLFRALSDGILAKGATIIDLGIVPTPTVAFATLKYNCRGIMITASHNPEEFNGLKFIESGKEIDKELEKEIENKYKENRVFKSNKKGEIIQDEKIVDFHIEKILEQIDAKAVKEKTPKIVVDSNGAAAVITPKLLRKLGARVIEINSELNGFKRPSEPNDANIGVLKEFVVIKGADFGIAHDGDGDRCIIVDENGETLHFDTQLSIMIENELEREKMPIKQTVISTVESSISIREIIEKSGNKIEITPVGSTYIGDKMSEVGACFGGEPCGEYVFSYGVHLPDAQMAAAKFTEIFCKKGKFSVLKQKYKQYPILREKFKTQKDKYQVVEKIKKEIELIFKNAKIRNDDGIRIDESDGWFLIRASGTEPLIRLTMEYKEKDKLENKMNEIRKLIHKNI